VYLLILRLGLLPYSCGAPLSAISMAVIVIPNMPIMFNEKQTIFKKIVVRIAYRGESNVAFLP
jgi:hypothetical protein